MKVIVMGCGRVGEQVSRLMADEGHAVVVIDRDPDALARLGSQRVHQRQGDRMKRTALLWRLRVIGVVCGFGMGVSLMVIGQGPVEHHDLPLTMRELMQWLVLPIISLCVAAIGYFGRDAYQRLKIEVDQIRSDVRSIREDLADRYVRRDDWREEWRLMYQAVERLETKLDERFLRLGVKVDSKLDRNNHHA